jgi:hypothetical protein
MLFKLASAIVGSVDPFGIYRPQATLFVGRSDGKFGETGKEVFCIQMLTGAGDDRVGVNLAFRGLSPSIGPLA